MKEPSPALPEPPERALEQAAERDARGRLRGHHVFNARGDLILVRPGVLSLAATPERGAFVAGLKDGQRLAAPSEIEARKNQVNKSRAAAGKKPV